MAENRIKRDNDTREPKARKRSWQRPEVLPSPKPQDGYEFRWVRVSTQGQTDATNVSSKLREGWEPVKAEDHPEFALTDKDERFEGNILQGGLLLCKAPTELVQERNDYYENQSRSQMHSVDNNLMSENDPRMPLFYERTTKVTNFGKGT